MTLMELLLVWYAGFLPLGELRILRGDARAVIFEVPPHQKIEFFCDRFEDHELPSWEINTLSQQHTLVPRRAFELGWCDGWRSQFKQIITRAHHEPLVIFGFMPHLNIPPEKPGLSFVFHFIKNSSGDCLGHFAQACEESEEENWRWLSAGVWSVID